MLNLAAVLGTLFVSTSLGAHGGGDAGSGYAARSGRAEIKVVCAETYSANEVSIIFFPGCQKGQVFQSTSAVIRGNEMIVDVKLYWGLRKSFTFSKVNGLWRNRWLKFTKDTLVGTQRTLTWATVVDPESESETISVTRSADALKFEPSGIQGFTWFYNASVQRSGEFQVNRPYITERMYPSSESGSFQGEYTMSLSSDRRPFRADLVISAEGALDPSTSAERDPQLFVLFYGILPSHPNDVFSF